MDAQCLVMQVANTGGTLGQSVPPVLTSLSITYVPARLSDMLLCE